MNLWLAGPLECVQNILAASQKPWWIAGGWAIDLYLGTSTRPHSDIEIAIDRSDQIYFRELLDSWSFYKRESIELLPWTDEEYLELPVHEIVAFNDAFKPDNLEILMNEFSGGDWLFRRDKSITLPIAELTCTSAQGIRFFCPEVVLLYKAKTPSEKDHDDFHAVVGNLNSRQREWLVQSIERCHPNHEWCKRL